MKTLALKCSKTADLRCFSHMRTNVHVTGDSAQPLDIIRAHNLHSIANYLAVGKNSYPHTVILTCDMEECASLMEGLMFQWAFCSI